MKYNEAVKRLFESEVLDLHQATIFHPSKRYNGVIHEELGRYIHQPNDKGYKYLLSSKKVFIELLRSFVRVRLELIDEASLVKVDKSYISSDFRGKESDLVYRLNAREQDIVFYVLLELQSKADPMMPFRLLSYQMEIWRDCIREAGRNAYRRHYRLPAIVPIVLYNGATPWNVPLSFKDGLGMSFLFDREVLDFQYFLIDVNRFSTDELKEHGNLISSVFVLDQAGEVAEVLHRLANLIDVIQRLSSEEQTVFWNWTARVLSQKLPEYGRNEIQHVIDENESKEVEVIITNIERAVQRSLVKERREGRMEGRLEGKMEGKLEGMREGKLEIAIRLLAKGMSMEEVSELTGLSAEDLPLR